MFKYKNILLATDLSDISEFVTKKAKAIADEFGAKLSIIHVLEYSPVAYGGEFSIPLEANIEQSLEANAREALANLASKYHVNVDHVYLKKGSVKKTVCDLANSLHVDLIIVGTHGHHGIDILLGSHANAILHKASCDVLVIRSSEEKS